MPNTSPPDVIDLEIHIFPRRERHYPVHIRLSDGRDFEGALAVAALSELLDGSAAVDGRRLFDTLFADPELRTAWDIAEGGAPRCRIRLWLDPEAPELHTLPWERLHDGDTLLAADTNSPFSRYLPVSEPWSEPLHERPLRVLVAIANPEDLEAYGLDRLDVARERALLEQAVAELPPDQVQLTFLEAPVSLEHLERELHAGYHVLHCVGHGRFNQAKGLAELYLEDEAGFTHIVPEQDVIATLRRQAQRPRLIFLATCQSATRSSVDAFAGLGPRLVEAGVPAVVTMQDLISIRSIAVLTPVFYAQLARHGEVDQALNAARGILATAQRPDATVPVLFMRLRHGRVWEEAARPEGAGAWLRAHLVPVLLAVLLILAGSAFGVWRALRPRPMRGEFNVAVAAFKQIPEDVASVATIASQMIYDFLESEYDLSSFEDVEVRHGGLGVIAEAPEARALAEAINAHLVIYGTVTVVGDDALISPKFFVAETFRADVGELNGQHQLALPVAFNVQDLIDYESAPNEKLRQKTAILTAFTKALAYLAADDLPRARDSIGTALAEAERYGGFEGQEVLYLFASDIGRRSEDFEAAQAYLDQALDLNPDYARAYVAQANIYYDQDNLAQAFAAYQQALEIEDQPYGALIVEKANLGLGNIYVYQYAAASENADATLSELATLADLALAHYRVVLDAYEAAHTVSAARSRAVGPQRRLRELAAQAAYFTGVVHEMQGDMAAARDAYRQARDLSASLPAPELNATVESQLESLP